MTPDTTAPAETLDTDHVADELAALENDPNALQALVDEATNPEATTAPKGIVYLVGEDGSKKAVRITFMAIKRERALFKVAKPLLNQIFEMGKDPGAIADVLIEAADVVPQIVGIIANGKEGVTLEWIEENVPLADLLDVVVEQLRKFKEQNLMGKFSALGAPQKGKTPTTGTPSLNA